MFMLAICTWDCSNFKKLRKTDVKVSKVITGEAILSRYMDIYPWVQKTCPLRRSVCSWEVRSECLYVVATMMK